MRHYHNIERSEFRHGEYVGWDSEGCRYRIKRENPYGHWWVYGQHEGCLPVFYAPTLRRVSLCLDTRYL